MEEDLLFKNKFITDLNISNEYLESKKDRYQNVQDVQDVHKVFEKSYVYSINSKHRESYFLSKVENDDPNYNIYQHDNMPYESIDIGKINAEYNALNVPNSVVDPYVMKDGTLYFKRFLHQYPNDYVIQLPYNHTNVKMIRIIGSFLPYSINNITKFNNHVAIDVLFGSDQQQENTSINLHFGTHIINIPPGNYNIDEVCSNIVEQFNSYYSENFVNNSDRIYDNVIENNLFYYHFNSLTKEIKFTINQPSDNIIIETQIIHNVNLNENIFYFTSESTVYNAVLSVTEYDNFLNFIQQISRSMNLVYCNYNTDNYKQNFSIFLRNNNYYLCSSHSEFSLNTDLMHNISNALNIDHTSTVNSSTDELHFVDITSGYNNFIAFSTNSKNRIYFTVDDNDLIAYIPDRQYNNYEDFIINVINSLNETVSMNTDSNINFNFEIQEQLKVQELDVNEDEKVNNYYITCDVSFSFNTLSMNKNAVKMFGLSIQPTISSTVHSIKLENDNFYYKVSGTNYVNFIFNNNDYIAVIEPKNYKDYHSLVSSIVDSMNLVCSEGYFSYQLLENSQNNYSICSHGAFTLKFSEMPVIGSLFYPPFDYDIESTNNCIILRNGYEIFNNNVYYDAYNKNFSKFYFYVREQEPAEPYEESPEFTNKLFIIDIQEKKYSRINELLYEILTKINNAVSEVYFYDNGNPMLWFDYVIESNKITFKCTSLPENKYEFNIASYLMPDLCYFMGIEVTNDTNYYTSYTSKYDYGNRLRFKMSFENNPKVNECDQLWYMLGYRLNSTMSYVQGSWTNMFNFGNDTYHFTNLDFVNKFIPTQSTEITPDENMYRPYRFPNMNKKECIYLKINNYENIYDPSLVDHKLFTQFHFNENDFGKYTTNNFIDKPYIFQTTLSELNKLHLTFIDSNGNDVDFGDIDHYITIEIIELKDMLTMNNYNSRRGQTENENYTNALFLNYGVNKK